MEARPRPAQLLFRYGYDFIRCVDFTRIAASNIVSDDVTNYVTHRTFNTELSYFVLIL